MNLLDLRPQFLRYEQRAEGIFLPMVDSIEAAQGVEFLCPKCFEENHGPIGTHGIICWSRSRGVPKEAEPGPGRWALVGTGLHDLTLNADPPGSARSVQLTSGCKWHGFVTNGEVTTA